jgi:hypothetical protein
MVIISAMLAARAQVNCTQPWLRGVQSSKDWVRSFLLASLHDFPANGNQINYQPKEQKSMKTSFYQQFHSACAGWLLPAFPHSLPHGASQIRHCAIGSRQTHSEGCADCGVKTFTH